MHIINKIVAPSLFFTEEEKIFIKDYHSIFYIFSAQAGIKCVNVALALRAEQGL